MPWQPRRRRRRAGSPWRMWCTPRGMRGTGGTACRYRPRSGRAAGCSVRRRPCTARRCGTPCSPCGRGGLCTAARAQRRVCAGRGWAACGGFGRAPGVVQPCKSAEMIRTAAAPGNSGGSSHSDGQGRLPTHQLALAGLVFIDWVEGPACQLAVRVAFQAGGGPDARLAHAVVALWQAGSKKEVVSSQHGVAAVHCMLDAAPQATTRLQAAGTHLAAQLLSIKAVAVCAVEACVCRGVAQQAALCGTLHAEEGVAPAGAQRERHYWWRKVTGLW